MCSNCVFIGFLIGVFFLSSCKEKVADEPEILTFSKPIHFPEAHYNFQDNPIQQEVFDLGRHLFYDTRLSGDNSTSCASCHHPQTFADPGKPLSLGFGNASGDRNSIALTNLPWKPNFMWDGGVNHIEITPLAAIDHPAELNINFADLLEKLRGIPVYIALFERAFGTSEINDLRFLQALTQFMGLLQSSNSKYDQHLQGKASFSSDEVAGLQLFEQHCAICHAGVLQTDHSFRNNGLDSTFADEGRKRITNQEQDLGKFRVPSLRNVAHTFPYMHDGRFNTLDEVLEHYINGIKLSSTIDSDIDQNLALSPEEKQQIIQFLHTLTDLSSMSEERFSNPF